MITRRGIFSNFGMLFFSGCGDDKKSKKKKGGSIEDAPLTRSEAEAGKPFRQPAGGQVGTVGAEEGRDTTSARGESERQRDQDCLAGSFACFDNEVWRCVSGDRYEFILDCGRTVCDENLGICRSNRSLPYVCDTQNQFEISFHEGTKNLFRHDGPYSCGPLCPMDEGVQAQPVFSRPGQSLYFEAPVCTNARQIRIFLETKVPAGEVSLGLRIPFQEDPYRLEIDSSAACNSRSFAVADFESRADFGSILRSGWLPITLEAHHWNPGRNAPNAQREEIGGDCLESSPEANFPPWYFGLSRVTVVSCYEMIKGPEGNPSSSCEHPACTEIGARRCYGEVLEECGEEGWVVKEICAPEQKCGAGEGRCLSPVEVCGESLEILFDRTNSNRYTAQSFQSCSSLCPQFDADFQPLFGSDGDFVTVSFQLPEGFQDPDIVHLDLTSKISPGGSQFVLAGDMEKEIFFHHSCAPRRLDFTREEGILTENGEIPVTILPGFGVPNLNHDYHREDRDGGSCLESRFYSGISHLLLTPCNLEYR